MTADRLLSTYVNDHLAASLGALELARRAAAANRDTPTGAALTELTEAIEADREGLQRIMNQLGAGPDRLKLTIGWTAEKLGRLKLNGRLFEYSPLSRLEEIELLLIGVEGKLLLWQALQELPQSGGLTPPLDELISRARSQRRRLRRLHADAAKRALA